MRRSARSALPGGHLSRRHGESLEFAELRPYQPGDDLRSVDWNAYLRLRKLLVRRFRAEQTQDVYILLDTSGSMEVPREKFDLARRIAGAAAVIASGEHDRLTLLPFREVVTGRFVESRRGRMPVEVLRTLSGLVCEGSTAVAASAEAATAMMRRAGLVMIISDFLDPKGLDSALKALAARGAQTVGVQVYAPEEARPRLLGPLTLEDAESGEEHELTMSGETNRAYMELFEEYQRGLRRRFQEAGGSLVSLETGTPLPDALIELFDPRDSALPWEERR